MLTSDEQQRGNHYLRVMARLKPGVSPRQAQADLDVIATRIAAARQNRLPGSIRLVPLREQMEGSVRKILLILLGAVSFVLLIACANVANLQLARASARQKEIAIRAALGAGRRRVVRQLLTESVLLATFGGLLGTLFAWLLLKTASHAVPEGLPGDASSVDWPMLVYATAVSLITGILFGLAPALQSTSRELTGSLKQGGRSSASGGGFRLRGALMVSEVALSLVLLTGAGLLIRSFIRLLEVKPGFDTGRILTMFVALPHYAYRDAPQQVAFYQRALAELSAQPGVQAIGAIDDLPLTNDRDSGGFGVEGRPALTVDQLPTAQQRSVSPGYFKAMGVPLIAGRAFTDADADDSLPVILINQTLARRVFPDENPVGKRVTWGLPGPKSAWMTIVGVVGDVHDLGLDAVAEMELYQPFTQSTLPYMNLVIRTAGDPATLIPAVRSAWHGLDKNLPLTPPKPMEQVLAESIAARRFHMLLLSGFAAIALLLAAAGIYGVVSYSVAQRTNEIGLRMALGAAQSQVLKLVIGRSLMLTSIGVGVGLLAALGLTEFLSSMLFGVRAMDPLTLAAVSLVLALVATAASYIPAYRAMKVDPVVALRNE